MKNVHVSKVGQFSTNRDKNNLDSKINILLTRLSVLQLVEG